MRRIAVVVAVVSLFLFGFGFGVNAQAPSPPRTASDPTTQQTSRVNHRVLRELERIRSLAPNVTLCSSITANSDVSKLIDCLNRVTKFAKSTQNELNALNKFVNKFFNCTDFVLVTQYGDPFGSQGYVYDPGTGTTFKTTALAFTENVQTDPFLNFYVVRNTQACIDFHSQRPGS